MPPEFDVDAFRRVARLVLVHRHGAGGEAEHGQRDRCEREVIEEHHAEEAGDQDLIGEYRAGDREDAEIVPSLNRRREAGRACFHVLFGACGVRLGRTWREAVSAAPNAAKPTCRSAKKACTSAASGIRNVRRRVRFRPPESDYGNRRLGRPAGSTPEIPGVRPCPATIRLCGHGAKSNILAEMTIRSGSGAMSTTGQHVTPNLSGGWSVFRSGTTRASRVFRSHDAAVAYARAKARQTQADLLPAWP